jgi:sigma-E factor negative regulatory protein RseA
MERISALMDGELDDHEVAGELQRLKHDPELRSAWDTYHAIGDTLRGHGVVSAGFAASVGTRLQAEPTILAPKRPLRRFARVALPVAASMCGVALVAWLALYNDTFQFGQPAKIARAPQQQTAQALVPAASAVNEYLLAHQQFSPRTDIQGVASYVRTVSVDVAGNE